MKEKGLTKHENWWPAIVQMACRGEGKQPDATILAFSETYEGKRAVAEVLGEGTEQAEWLPGISAFRRADPSP